LRSPPSFTLADDGREQGAAGRRRTVPSDSRESSRLWCEDGGALGLARDRSHPLGSERSGETPDHACIGVPSRRLCLEKRSCPLAETLPLSGFCANDPPSAIAHLAEAVGWQRFGRPPADSWPTWVGRCVSILLARVKPKRRALAKTGKNHVPRTSSHCWVRCRRARTRPLSQPRSPAGLDFSVRSPSLSADSVQSERAATTGSPSLGIIWYYSHCDPRRQHRRHAPRWHAEDHRRPQSSATAPMRRGRGLTSSLWPWTGTPDRVVESMQTLSPSPAGASLQSERREVTSVS
jgi:hypothetical protein